MRQVVFELCAETIDACLAAAPGGAHRIELCSALSEGGVTPSHGLIREAVHRSNLPVHVLLRPRGGNFLYTEAELAVMRDDLRHIRELGAAGVVLGLLTPRFTIDIPRTRELVALAGPLEVTFHRAFDEVPSLNQALEDILATGCRRILTSGGQPDVEAGATALHHLIHQAAGRIEIAIGGGLRLDNAARIATTTGATHFHGSLRTPEDHAPLHPQDIRMMIERLSASVH